MQVRSTPAFFLFKNSELLAHWASSEGDMAQLEQQIRQRLPADLMPSQPVLSQM